MMPSNIHAKNGLSPSWATFLEVFLRQLSTGASLLRDHKHHASSAKAFLTAGKDGFCALHTLGETYSSLTNLPVDPRITGSNGLMMVKQVYNRLNLISLNAQEYFSALEAAASRRIIGGTVYDSLIAQCALKARADVLLTWNARHFALMGPDIQHLVKTPLEL